MKKEKSIKREDNTEEEKQILKQRAIKLSAKVNKQVDVKNQMEVIRFLIADEVYAFANTFVSEVYVVKTIVPIPGIPEFIVGIISIRGEIISVIDIKNFFGLPQKGVTNLNNVIVLENVNMKFGVLADEIIDTTYISKSELQEKITTFENNQQKYFVGITEDETIILDAEKLLNDESLIIDEKMIS